MSNTEHDILLRRGTFKCALKHEMVYVFAAGMVWLLITVISYFVLRLWERFPHGELEMGIFAIIAVAFGTLYLTAFNVITNGAACEYRAEKTEFMIKGPRKQTEYFYYNDVCDIKYEPMKLHGRVRGYVVTIITGVREVEYRYIFGENKIMTEIDDTPFYYLAVNSGLIQHEERPSGITMEQVAAMFAQKEMDKYIEKETGDYNNVFDDEYD